MKMSITLWIKYSKRYTTTVKMKVSKMWLLQKQSYHICYDSVCKFKQLIQIFTNQNLINRLFLCYKFVIINTELNIAIVLIVLNWGWLILYIFKFRLAYLILL